MKRRNLVILPAILIVLSLIFLAYPGTSTATLGQTGWASPLNISHSAASSRYPSVAVTTGGEVHVVWEESGLVYHSYEKDGVWSAPCQLFPGIDPVLAPLGGDVIGMLFVQPHGGASDVFFTYWDGSAWASPRDISQTSGNSASPDLAVGPGGHLYAVWSDTTPGYPVIYWADSGDGLVWSNSPVPDASGTSPSAVVSKDGTLYVAWQQRYAGGTTPYEVFLSSYTSKGGWSIPVDISDSPDVSSTSPDISASPDGTIHMVWQEGDKVFYTWGLLGGWAAPKQLSGPGNAYMPKVQVDYSGAIHAVWDENTAILYRYCPSSGGKWKNEETVASDNAGARNAALAVDMSYSPHLVWEDRSGAGDIFYSVKSATSGLSQKVLLPLVMSR